MRDINLTSLRHLNRSLVPGGFSALHDATSLVFVCLLFNLLNLDVVIEGDSNFVNHKAFYFEGDLCRDDGNLKSYS
jgi:hypothetical protein